MKTLFLTLSLLCWLSPPEHTWKTLYQVDFKVQYLPEIEDFVFLPVPNEAVLALEGKTIILKGERVTFNRKDINDKNTFVITEPDWERPDFISLEEYGVKLHSKEPLSLQKGKTYTFQGVFHFNTKDKLDFAFQLKEAVCLDC